MNVTDANPGFRFAPSRLRYRVKLKAAAASTAGVVAQSAPQSARLVMRFDTEDGLFHMFTRFLLAVAVVLLPAMADAADITGVPKIREGDHIQIGNTRIRLGGIDAPSVDQLCPNTQRE